MIDYREREQIHSIEEAVGKTVEEVHNGYEETVFAFEDGTYYSEYTFSGNPRDI